METFKTDAGPRAGLVQGLSDIIKFAGLWHSVVPASAAHHDPSLLAELAWKYKAASFRELGLQSALDVSNAARLLRGQVQAESGGCLEASA